jgi:rubrerythrin
MPEKKQNLPTAMEILQAALHKEKEAYAFYDGLLKKASVDFVAELIEELRDAEYHHMKRVEQKILELQKG